MYNEGNYFIGALRCGKGSVRRTGWEHETRLQFLCGTLYASS